MDPERRGTLWQGNGSAAAPAQLGDIKKIERPLPVRALWETMSVQLKISRVQSPGACWLCLFRIFCLLGTLGVAADCL